mgnify:CR=1 FL=1
MRAKLVRIGNSRGVRLPKAMIEEAGLGDDLELTVRDGEIVIARVKKKFAELQPSFPEGMQVKVVYDRDFVIAKILSSKGKEGEK